MARPRKTKPRSVDYASTRIRGSSREWTRWWDVDEDGIAAAVEDRCRQLWNDDQPRRDEIERNLKRWGLTMAGLYADPSGSIGRARDALRINLTKSLTETITAKVGKNRPRPLVLTDGGHFTNKQRAKKLQRFLDGAYQQANVYEALPLWFRNAMLAGTGILGVTGDPYASRFVVENVFPLEVLVDNVDGVRGDPRCIYRMYPVDKDALIEDYPEAMVEIESAAMYGPEGALPNAQILNGQHRDVRTVVVCEAWRRSRMNAAGELVCGRHVLTCNGAALIDEDWTDDSFPFVFLHWNAPVRGFWGDSAVSEVRPIEREVNILLQRAQDSMRRSGLAIMMSPKDAHIQQQKTGTEPMMIFQYEGQIQPTVVTPAAAHPQIISQPMELMRLAANQLGTNELQISGSKPAGVESGRALEQLSEEHAVRFDTVSKSFEIRAAKHLAVELFRVARRMDDKLKAAGKGGFKLRSTYKKEFIDLNFGECALGPDEFFLDVFPVSVLPHTPAGRTAEVERWQDNKWLSADEAKELLEFPDLESVGSVSRAAFELLEWQLEQMLDKGLDVQVEPRQDLELSRRFGTHAKLKAQREGYPMEHIELLEEWLQTIDEMLMPPPPAATDPSMPVPQGMPAPVPPPMPGQLAPDPAGPGMGATAPTMPLQAQLQM